MALTMPTALRRHWPFTAFAAITGVVTAALLPFVYPPQALLIGFDAGALAFVALLAGRFRADEADRMRERAAENEPDHATMTGIALLIIAVVLTAVTLELLHSKAGDRTGVLLAAATLVIAWVFTNAMFTLHYAHLYYLPPPGHPDDRAGGDRGGLDFPGGETSPDYWDFAYFAFVLGMTFQVSDVVISARHIRRLALGHALLAFFFNIAVVALSVSLVGSALGG